MINAVNHSTEAHKPGIENQYWLLLHSMGYIALSDGPFTPSEIQLASEIISRAAGQTYTMTQVNSEWKQLVGRIDAFLTGVATIASQLSEQHKEFIIFHCGLMAAYDGRVSEIENRALQRLAATLAISHEGYNRSLNAVLKTTADALTKAKATSSASTKQAVPTANPSDSKTNSERSRNYLIKGTLFVLLIVSVIGVYLIDFRYDYDQYIIGYKAYATSNCMTALSYFDRLSDNRLLGWHVGLTNKFETMARTEANHCEALAKAEQMQILGNYGDALLQLVSISPKKVPPFIYDTAQKRLQNLSHTIQPEALATLKTCQQSEQLNLKQFFSDDHNLLASFYLACSDIFVTQKMEFAAFNLLVQILTDFPEFAGVAQVEKALLASSATCDQSSTLMKKERIKERNEFMGELYVSCGQHYEKQKDYKNAIRIYEEFTQNYETHQKLSDINTVLAQSLFNYALSLGAPEIPAPSRSGTTNRGKTVVIIRNDSPESMRISFSGPESRIEELDACKSCTTFSLFKPDACPDQGPYDTYTLKPGTYNVVVESTSGQYVTPFIGTWELENGSEYSHCFYIVTTKVLR